MTIRTAASAAAGGCLVGWLLGLAGTLAALAFLDLDLDLTGD